jgi:hypothetical protein
MEHRRGLVFSGELRRPLLPSIKSEPFIFKRVAQDQPYPFEGLFVKETLPFPIIMPAVLGRFKIRIFFYLFQFI